jgi:hypothetical protein
MPSRYRVQVHGSINPVVSMNEAGPKPSSDDIAEYAPVITPLNGGADSREIRRVAIGLLGAGAIDVVGAHSAEQPQNSPSLLFFRLAQESQEIVCPNPKQTAFNCPSEKSEGELGTRPSFLLILHAIVDC